MITINWSTRVINVPKADLTLIQATPTEIMELNLNAFRLALKDLEDSDEGMTFPSTHNHNPEVLLGGIVYARVIEIINGYTVTFEDGQYAVNLTGANSNVGDVVNVNQVSVRTSNAAGLISNAAIEYSSFNGGVTIDVTNGSTGTVFPKGTLQAPVNNIADALIIAQYRGLNTFILNGTLVLTNTDVSGYTFKGSSPLKSVLVLSGAGNTTSATSFYGLILVGYLNGHTYVEQCGLQTISNIGSDVFPTIFYRCIVRANSGATPALKLRSGLSTPQNLHFIETVSGVPSGDLPTIDFNNSNTECSFKKYSGGLKVINYSGGYSTFDFDQGKIVLNASTITGGTILSRGLCNLVDESGNKIDSGSFGGGTIVNESVNTPAISEAVWDNIIESGFTAEQLMRIFGSVLAGKVSGAGSGVETFRDLGDSKGRVISTVDNDGNRTSIVLDAS